MNIRNWSIRAKIVILVVPPILVMVAFWSIGTTLSAASSINLLNARTVETNIVSPGRNMIDELQAERRLSAVVLAGNRGAAAALADQRTQTDVAAATFKRQVQRADTRDAASERTVERLAEAITALDALPATRETIDRGGVGWELAVQGYHALIDATYHAFLPLSELDDAESSRLSRATTSLGYARELLAREDAIVATVVAADRFNAFDHGGFAQAVGSRRGLYTEAGAELPEPLRTQHRRVAESRELAHLEAVENRLISDVRATSTLPAAASEWQAAYRAAVEQLRRYEESVAAALVERTDAVASTYYWRLGITGAAGLLAVIGSILLAVRVGRSLIRRLRGLRGAALELSNRRLPDVIRRLHQGERVDVDAETPSLTFGNDEIGQVGHAFSEVQRTAVESAVQEANLRQGLNEVFLNIARRSQTLLHRQLSVLDGMERRATDPEELEDLFRVDHLATRMRRHAEDLVILAGAAPGRGWRQPVPLIDVIRGAVSEVEEYARIKVLSVPDAALTGRAVADVVHLLAELLENATSYSPPHTRVQLAGELVPNGFAIEIEDRGLGMSAEEMEAANRRLAQPPDFDPANSARLGLFVVALLAARLGIKVTLRSSPYGGVTAVALIPLDLIEDAVPPSLPSTMEGARRAAAQRQLESARTEADRSRAVGRVQIPGQHVIEAQPATVAVASPDVAHRFEPELTPDGLPRRVRRPEPVEESTVEETQPLAARPPEQMRAMMSAFQAGMARGRQEAASAAVPRQSGSRPGSTGDADAGEATGQDTEA